MDSWKASSFRLRGIVRALVLTAVLGLLLFGFSAPAWALRVIKITPASGPCGTEITVTGTGFTGGNKVTVNYGGCDSTSDVQVSSTGTFTATVKADCDKASSNGVVAEEYNSQDTFTGKSNRLDFRQTTGCKNKQFMTTVMSVEASDNKAFFITHNKLGAILSQGTDTTCVAGTTGGQAPAECGNVRIFNWGVASLLEGDGMVKSIVSFGPPDQLDTKFNLFCLEVIDNSIGMSARVKTAKKFEDVPHFFSFGGQEAQIQGSQRIHANPDIYFVSKTSTKTIFQEGVFNLQTSGIVGPFKTLLSLPAGTAAAAYASSSGDLVGFLKRGVGTVESLHRVGSQTGGFVLLNQPNVFGVTMDITPAIGEITPAPEPSARRLAIYSVIIQNGASFTRAIFVQVFNAQGAALTPRGPARMLQPFQNSPFAGAERIFSNVAIADDGSFAVYSAYNPSCNKGTLWYQKLNPVTGAKIGARKALLDCSALTTSILGSHALDLMRIR